MHRIYKTVIDLKTGKEISREEIEPTDEEYDRLVIQPLAKILYKQVKRDIELGNFHQGNNIKMLPPFNCIADV